MSGHDLQRLQSAPERPNTGGCLSPTIQKAAEASRAPRGSGMALHTAEGLRKYLAAGEREAFLREAEQADRADRTRCMTLAYVGCRLSEALALTVDRVDLGGGARGAARFAKMAAAVGAEEKDIARRMWDTNTVVESLAPLADSCYT